jgi:hypothetical protein
MAEAKETTKEAKRLIFVCASKNRRPVSIGDILARASSTSGAKVPYHRARTLKMVTTSGMGHQLKSAKISVISA